MEYQSFSKMHEFGDHGDPVTAMTFFPHSNKLLTASEDFVHLWDLKRKKRIVRFRIPGIITSLAVEPEEERFLVGFEEGGVQIWSIQDQSHFYSFPNREANIQQLSLSPDGQFMAYVEENQIMIYNLTTMRPERKKRITTDCLLSVTWSPTGEYYLTGSEEGYVTMWELATSRKVWQQYEQGFPIQNIDFHSNNEYICSQRWEKIIVRYVGNGIESGQYSGLEGEATDCFFEPLGLFVIGASMGPNGDNTIRFFNLDSKRLVRTLFCDDMTKLVMSNSGHRLVAGTKDGVLVVFGPHRGI